jgi:putative ABC transport system permease protein
MPQVEDVAAAYAVPYGYGVGGNQVSFPGQDEQINIYDFGNASVNYLSLMEIPMIEGPGFTAGAAGESAVISRSLAERIEALTGWTDGVVGKKMNLPAHGESTIVGVYDKLRVRNMLETDDRPSALFLFTDPDNPGLFGVRDVVVKLNGFTDENIAAVRDALPNILPNSELSVQSMRDEIHGAYESIRMFRNNVMAASLIILAIAIVGLIGFVYNETNRRSAEIAIRKIHGATSENILKLLGFDVGRVALAALIPGAAGAGYAAGEWMRNFTEKASLPPGLFIAGCLVLLALVVSFTLLYSLRIARRNPVDLLQKG